MPCDASASAAASNAEADAAPPPLSYDAALDAVGTGAFTTRMTLLCGLGNAADAIELLSVSLVLPAVGPDGRGSLRLSLQQLATLSAALFWGALVGTLACGVLSDALGRQKALSCAMAVAGVFGLLSALTTSFGALRMVTGHASAPLMRPVWRCRWAGAVPMPLWRWRRRLRARRVRMCAPAERRACLLARALRHARNCSAPWQPLSDACASPLRSPRGAAALGAARALHVRAGASAAHARAARASLAALQAARAC
jgi:hypothetical protein